MAEDARVLRLALFLCLWLGSFTSGAMALVERVEVRTLDEFQRAFEDNPVRVHVLNPIQINHSSWTTVNISSSVTVFSPGRVVIDFCDEACNRGESPMAGPVFRVLPGARLEFSKIFFRNFIPRNLTAPSAASSAPAPSVNYANSPNPFIKVEAGGILAFSVVVWHFLPEMTWVFNTQPSYWNAISNVITPMNSTGPGESSQLQFQNPQLYYIKSHVSSGVAGGGQVQFTNCFIPMDLHRCYSDKDLDKALVYCPYTFRDSIWNPTVNRVVVFHDIGLDRLSYSFSNPLHLNRSVVYIGCKPSVKIDLDGVYGGVVLDHGSITFVNLTIGGSASVAGTEWPADFPLLLSAFQPMKGSQVTLSNVQVSVADPKDLKKKLDELPAGGVADPSRPNLRPVYGVAEAGLPGSFVIDNWRLSRNEWLLFQRKGIDFDTNLKQDSSSWSYENVLVSPNPVGTSCFQGAVSQGSVHPENITVVTSAQDFIRVLSEGSWGRFAEIRNDIVLRERDIRRKDGRPLVVTKSVELRACRNDGKRYKLDFGNLHRVILVDGNQQIGANTLMFQGDLEVVGTGWDKAQPGIDGLVAALRPLGEGKVQFEGVVINGIPPRNLTGEGFLHDSVRINRAMTMNVTQTAGFDNMYLVSYEQGQENPMDPGRINGIWSFADTKICWRYSAAQEHTNKTVIIACSVLGAVALVAAMSTVAYCFVKRGRHQSKDAKMEAGEAAEHGPSFIKPILQRISKGVSEGSTNTSQPLSTVNTSTNARSATGPSRDILEACQSLVSTKTSSNDTVVLENLLGEGSYGKVYKGTWKGTVVAVKIMILPSYLSGKEKREKMAVMETAISSSVSHPNIVQTFTYAVEPIKGKTGPSKKHKGKGNSFSLHDSTVSLSPNNQNAEVHSWEVRLVQEFCDVGSLREVINRKVFLGPDKEVNMLTVMDTALDIARAMAHLHSQNIIHSDLKARNVLIKSSVMDARGFVAKVADFGLSLKIDPLDTHISNAFQGTMTHMAPETLMHGRISRASDTYAYGILLWELFTGEHAFRGVPRALLGHQIASQGLRPVFPEGTPWEYQFLAMRCWETDPNIRPTFEQVLEELKRLRRRLVEGPQDGGQEDLRGLDAPCEGPPSWLGDQDQTVTVVDSTLSGDNKHVERSPGQENTVTWGMAGAPEQSLYLTQHSITQSSPASPSGPGGAAGDAQLGGPAGTSPGRKGA